MKTELGLAHPRIFVSNFVLRWKFQPAEPEAILCLARYVARGGALLDAITARAFELFAPTDRHKSFAMALGSQTPEERAGQISQIVRCLYTAARQVLAERHIHYEYERGFDPLGSWQRVLSVEEIEQGRSGTCLDLALLGAALAAQTDLCPLVVILVGDTGNHAVAAVDLTSLGSERGDSRSPAAMPLERVVAGVSAGSLVAFDCTGLVSGYPNWPDGLDFDQACHAARQSLEEAAQLERGRADRRFFSVAVDVQEAWLRGFHFYTMQEMAALLRPVDFTDELERRAARFVGRRQILADVQHWLHNAAAPPVYWIRGEPGIGKSALAAYLCRTLNEVCAFFFLRAHDRERAEPARVAATIAFQLSTIFPAYAERLAYTDLRAELVKPGADVTNALLKDRLADLVGASSGPPIGTRVLIVIDGLDEAELTPDGTNTLATFVGERRTDLPAGVRLLVTSRDDPAVATALRGIAPRTMIASDAENLSDIAQYLTNNLPGDLLPSRHPEVIAARSEGSFLWVTSWLDVLAAGGEVDALPPGMAALYSTVFDRLFSSPNSPDYAEWARPLFEMLVAARGPLAIPLVADVIGLPAVELSRRVARLAGVVMHDDDQITARHKHFVDWVTDRREAGTYAVDPSAGHQLLGVQSLKYLQTLGTQAPQYAIDHAADHLLESRRWSELRHLVFLPGLKVVERWIDCGALESGIRVLGALRQHLDRTEPGGLAAAEIGTQVARLLILQGRYDAAEVVLIGLLEGPARATDRRVLAVALHMRGSVALYRGAHDQARRYYQDALDACLDTEPVIHDEAAANLLALGKLCWGAPALGFAERARSHAVQAGDHRHWAGAEALAADACKYLATLDQARQHVAAGYAVCDSHKVVAARTHLMYVEASVAYYAAVLHGRPWSLAQQGFTANLAHAKGHGDWFGARAAEAWLAWCALAERDWQTAGQWIEPLANVVRPDTHKELFVTVQLALAGVHQLTGDHLRAARFFDEALRVSEELPEWLLPWRLRALAGLGATSWHHGRRMRALALWTQTKMLSAKAPPLMNAVTAINIAQGRSDPRFVPR